MRYLEPSDQCKNLYRFIRLVLGEDVSDREIARRWGVDEKNLRELKKGLRVVPKLSRLEDLAEALGVRKYYILEVASGIPADKVHQILRNYVVEDQLSLIETTFAGARTRQVEIDLVRAGLDSAVHLAYRTLEPEQLFTKVSQICRGASSRFASLMLNTVCSIGSNWACNSASSDSRIRINDLVLVEARRGRIGASPAPCHNSSLPISSTMSRSQAPSAFSITPMAQVSAAASKE